MSCTPNTVSDNTTGETYFQTPTNASIVGTKILSGNSLIGENCCSLSFQLKTGDTLSGDVIVGRVADSNTTGNFDSSSTVDVSTLSLTSSYQTIDFTSLSLGTIAEDDILGIKFAGTGGDIDVRISTGTPTMSNQEIRYLTGGTWTNNGYYVLQKIGTGVSPSTDQVLLPPPVAWI